MSFFKEKTVIYPNTKGFLYTDMKFSRKLEPGVHKIKLNKNRDFCIILSFAKETILPVNQEVLTKDNISLRFSYLIQYKVQDGKILLENSDLSNAGAFVVSKAQNTLHYYSQIYFRNEIADVESEELNSARKNIETKVLEQIKNEALKIGIEITDVMIRDIYFPKNIQDILAKQLETKIRAKIDLQNARTQVAAARALKNASDMMKDNDNIKFLQVLEAISKIADKGKHTFIIGEPLDIIKNVKK